MVALKKKTKGKRKRGWTFPPDRELLKMMLDDARDSLQCAVECYEEAITIAERMGNLELMGHVRSRLHNLRLAMDEGGRQNVREERENQARD